MAIVLASAVPATAASPAVISGSVTSQNGVPVPDVAVTTADPGTTGPRHGPAFTGPDGRFTLVAETGDFDVRFDPPTGSGLSPVVQSGVQVNGDLTINVQLVNAPTTPPTHRFSGTVTTHEGGALQNLRVSLGGTMSNANVGGPGGFAVDVAPGRSSSLAGTSGLASLIAEGVPRYPHGATISAGPDAPEFDLTAQDVTQNLRMPATTTISLTVLDAAGNPVSGGKPVSASGSSSPGTGFAFVPEAAAAYRFDSTESASATDAGGTAQLMAFEDVTFPPGGICVRTVPGFVDTFCNTTPVNTDNGPVSITLRQPAPPTHTLSGVVRTAAGDPVPRISLNLGSSFTTSLSDGRFSFVKSPGRYDFGVGGGSYGSGPLTVPGLPSFFSFSGPSDTIDLSTSDVTTDVRLPSTVTVTVHVTDAAGAPAANVPVDFIGTLAAHSLLGAGYPDYRANQSSEVTNPRTDASGIVRFTVFRGTELPGGTGICARFPVSPSTVCGPATLTADNDISLALTQRPPTPTYTVSGTVRDSAGNAVPRVSVAHGGSARTDTTGVYRITTDPGTYPFQVGGGSINGPLGVAGLPGYFHFEHQAIPLTGNVVRDIQLPATATATITLKDPSGNGVPNARVTVNGGFPGQVSLFPGEPASFTGATSDDGQTDAQGTFNTRTFRGVTFAPGQICVLLGTFDECNTTAVDTSAGDLTFVFQQQPPVPAVVTGLSVPSPTNTAPVLTWQTSATATSYDVHRDGVLIGNTTQAGFTDGTAADGPHSYTVAARNGAGAGPSTAPVTTVLDRVRPIVTGTPDRQPVAGWYTAPVTIAWQSDDPTPSSGTPSVPAPSFVQVEGRDQAVTSAQSCDPAANCATGEHRVSIDRTPPALQTPTWSTNPVAVGATTTIVVPATDTLSGVDRGEYFVGADPGVGNATPLTATLTATLGTGLTAGVHDIGVRARDIAGNWSPTTTTMLVIVDPAGAGVTGKNKKDLVPSLAAGDTLPGLVQQGQADSADYGFTVDYRDGALDSRSDFHLTYATGARCSTPNPVNCHLLTVTATSFDWLVIDQGSRATFQGTASVTVDGATTTNRFSVEGTDGDRLSPAQADQLVMTVYAADGSTVLYRASGAMPKGNSVRIR
ncbi:carboxypeptidase-like regulatory domain-containing protein [Lentzea sp. NPDC051838]|uniref:carboxypeptidase-like regulatory domain-containing protein n=1 Tax=Lentzea sp. NPDC051838 TaxID=3154849 RepID=UPI00341B6826